MPESTRQTVIENGTEFEGTIRSQCPITLSGEVSGEVDAPSLRVTSSGSLSGRVKVAQLASEGELAGEVEAETVELAGRVSDETVIRAKSLEVRLSQPDGGLQVSFGNCELQVGDREAGSARVKDTKPARAETPSEPAEDELADKVASLIK